MAWKLSSLYTLSKHNPKGFCAIEDRNLMCNVQKFTIIN